MPNFGKHLLIGGGIGSICYLGYCWMTKNKPSLQGAVVSLGLGSLGGTLPDLIEPATNPHRRKFFHSAGLTAFLASILKEYVSEDDTSNENVLALSILILSYLSHILSDSTTPKGIPIL